MLNYVEIIGIAGAILLIVAWIPELVDIVKSKKSKLNKRFSELLFFATLVLLIYSIMVKDFIFTVINAFLLAEISVSVYYTLGKTKKKH